MKIVSGFCLAVFLSTAAVAQQPTTAEVNEAAKKLRAEEAAKAKIDVEKALAMTRANAEKTGIAAPAPARVRQPVNVKVEFTLTDQRGAGAPAKRTVNAIVADGVSGQIRSSSDVMGVGGGVTLNIDTIPEILADGKIRLYFNLQYDWPGATDTGDRPPRGTVLKTVMHDSVTLILENGKPTVAAQSADPVVDRQVTVEVKATVLR